jgi:hypothetical protein
MSMSGEEGKRLGMARAQASANPAWMAAAAKAVAEAAKQFSTLTTDHVISLIDPSIKTHEMRAMGPVMRSAAKDGLIEKAMYEPPRKCATRPSNHRRPLQVWKSLIFRGKS